MLCGRILSAEAAVAAQRIPVDHTKAALFRDIHCGTVARRLFHDTGKQKLTTSAVGGSSDAIAHLPFRFQFIITGSTPPTVGIDSNLRLLSAAVNLLVSGGLLLGRNIPFT